MKTTLKHAAAATMAFCAIGLAACSSDTDAPGDGDTLSDYNGNDLRTQEGIAAQLKGDGGLPDEFFEELGERSKSVAVSENGGGDLDLGQAKDLGKQACSNEFVLTSLRGNLFGMKTDQEKLSQYDPEEAKRLNDEFDKSVTDSGASETTATVGLMTAPTQCLDKFSDEDKDVYAGVLESLITDDSAESSAESK